MSGSKIKFIVSGVFLTLAFANIAVFSQAMATANQTSGDGDLNVLKLVRESFANQLRANWRMSSEYSYKYLMTVKSKSKTETWLRESYFPARLKRGKRTNSVSVLLAKNGVPAAAEKIEKERREAAEKLEKADNESEEKSRPLEDLREKGTSLEWTWNDVSVGMHIFLGRCRFDSPRREFSAGRDAITLHFQSCTIAQAPENYAYLANIEGKLWLDAADKMPVRLEAYAKPATAATASVNNSPVIVFTQKKVAENLWLPASIVITGIGNEAVFPKLKVDRALEFSDYRKSQTEIKEVKIAAP